jgi:DNA-binding transcriptional regulator YiaG
MTKKHLGWKTPAQNQRDRIKDGTDSKGVRNGRAKLTLRNVKEIRQAKGKVSQNRLAVLFGIHQTTVSKIQRNQLWQGG